MYQSEFPVDQPVPVFDPTLLFLLILAGLAIAGLAFFADRLTGRGDKGEKRGDVPRIIHEAVKAKYDDAKTTSGQAHSVEDSEPMNEQRPVGCEQRGTPAASDAHAQNNQ